jgi:hypothetical protein
MEACFLLGRAGRTLLIDSALSNVLLVPWELSTYMVFPPANESETYLMKPWADGQKFCRSLGVSCAHGAQHNTLTQSAPTIRTAACAPLHTHLHVSCTLLRSEAGRLVDAVVSARDGCVPEASSVQTPAQAELPSLTDTYTREVLTGVYHPDLPSHMWIGLRSYGDGQVSQRAGERVCVAEEKIDVAKRTLSPGPPTCHSCTGATAPSPLTASLTPGSRESSATTRAASSWARTAPT